MRWVRGGPPVNNQNELKWWILEFLSLINPDLETVGTKKGGGEFDDGN